MYVVIVGGDNPKLKALPLIAQFQYIFDFVGSSFEGYVIGDANGLDEIQNDAEALAKAQIYNKEFKITSRNNFDKLFRLSDARRIRKHATRISWHYTFH